MKPAPRRIVVEWIVSAWKKISKVVVQFTVSNKINPWAAGKDLLKDQTNLINDLDQ